VGKGKLNLKPELKKYSYDSLMTDAVKEKQDGLVNLGRKEAVKYTEDHIKPLFSFEPDLKTVDIVIYELKEWIRQNG
jgi:hypothetical protein